VNLPGLHQARVAQLGRALTLTILFVTVCLPAADTIPSELRRPLNDADLKFWLENMVWHHRFSTEEISAATGMNGEEIRQATTRLAITPDRQPKRVMNDPLLVLPYPGGRHPRIGFLEGAIRPQRETKISIFTPWDESSYVVADIPEAIWSNLGLTYLAHTHIPTVFENQGVKLPALEWNRHSNGALDIHRKLPNGIEFGAKINPGIDAVRMELWLTNGTSATLRDLRVQNCVMLKEARGFNAQTNTNKVFEKPYVACASQPGGRWIITAWESCDRAWGNAPVPCLHSDPKFPDCPPGQGRHLRGWLSFYEGTNVQAEFQRIEKTGWRK
jgi:hypothetical protein